MARKRKREKRSKQRRPAGTSGPSSATMVVERIAAAGPNYFADNFIRIMQEGASLRQEPEFADLYFEPRQTLEASVRHLPRFKRRLARVARQDTKAATLAYDDYRIAVLDDLDTPQLRDQLQRRLEQCTDRLRHSHDADKFEVALILSVFLGAKASKIIEGKKPLPLGAYSLITTIYEESFDRAMVEVPDAYDIVGDDLYSIWCAKHNKKDIESITAAIEQIADGGHLGSFEELTQHIETNPALALAWERQEGYLIEELQSQITQAGLTFKPSLFTPDEAALTMDKMEQRHLNRPWSLSRYFVPLAMGNLMHCARETLDEIVTSQRMVRMIAAFRSVGQQFLESDDERLRALVPHVQAAIHHLQSEQTPSQNQIVQTVYLLSFFAALSDQDALSPRWQKLVKRLEQSRFLRRVGET